VFVICLADLKAKPDANHANTHPHQWPGRVKFATSTTPRPPLADLVSNPTPPGQIAGKLALLFGIGGKYTYNCISYISFNIECFYTACIIAITNNVQKISCV
jgi:hypothetical protein